jgi:hypothetical protein
MLFLQSNLREMQDRIRRTGKLPGGEYWSLASAVTGRPKRMRPGNFIARRASPGNAAVEVGEQPQGFGKGFVWDRKDEQILLALFINAADPLGISISGVQAGDTVQVTSATGIASYTEDKGNPLASSLVGLIGAGAKVGLGLAGFPEAAPLVDAAESFAKDQFKATNAKHKVRDAFGVDPGSGHKARQEGGLLVSLPEASGTYYSGDNDHKERWIRMPGDRTDANRPPHVVGAFFLRQSDSLHNTRPLGSNGEVFVTPWDWQFGDNAGYYKAFVLLTRGMPPSDSGPILLRRPVHRP